MRILLIILVCFSINSYGQVGAFWTNKNVGNDSVKTEYNTILNKGLRMPLLATPDTNKVAGWDAKGNIVPRTKGNGSASSIGDSLHNIYSDTIPTLRTLIASKTDTIRFLDSIAALRAIHFDTTTIYNVLASKADTSALIDSCVAIRNAAPVISLPPTQIPFALPDGTLGSSNKLYYDTITGFMSIAINNTNVMYADGSDPSYSDRYWGDIRPDGSYSQDRLFMELYDQPGYASATIGSLTLGNILDMENGLLLFGNIENKTIGGYTPAKLLMLRNDLWMGWYHAYGDGHTYMYMADEDSITSFSTGIAFIGEQEITTSNYDTMHNGIRFMLINPPLLIANDTIILSPDPKDGQEVLILYGGDISGDNPVVSAQVIYPNSGQTIVGIYPLATTTSTVISLKYKSVGSYWFVSAGGGSSATFDTTALSNRIDLKLNSADTASLSNRIDLKLNKTDTAGHWQPIGHLPIIVTVNATPSSVLTGTVTETNIASIKIPAG